MGTSYLTRSENMIYCYFAFLLVEFGMLVAVYACQMCNVVTCGLIIHVARAVHQALYFFAEESQVLHWHMPSPLWQ
jgi:hypothetical protein